MKLSIKVIYFDLNKDINWKGLYYEGIGSVMTVLKQAGHNVSFFHVIKLVDDEEILNFIGKDADLVAFSTTTNMFPFVIKWSSLIKKNYPDLPLLCGGNHPTLAPSETLKQSYIDWCCIGEGEKLVLDLCDVLNHKKRLEDVPNLAYKKGSKIIVNSTGLLEGKIDSFPIVDRSFFSEHIKVPEVFEVFTSRGCPFECSYCCNKAKKDVTASKSKYLRFHTPKRVIEELLLYKDNPNLKYIFFIDDVFGVDLKWLKEFSVLYKTHINLPFACLIHPNYMKNALIEILADMGCFEINVGLQSSDDQIRKDIMNRKMSMKQIVKAVNFCKEYKIIIKVDILFGVPTETKLQMINTLDVLATLQVDMAKSHVFYPYPYTKLEQQCREMGLIKNNYFKEDYHSGTILNFSNNHKKTILFMHMYSNKIVQMLKKIYQLNFISKSVCSFVFKKVVFSDVFISTIIISRDLVVKVRNSYRESKGIKEINFNKLGLAVNESKDDSKI